MQVGGDLLLVARLGVHDEPLTGTGPWVVDLFDRASSSSVAGGCLVVGGVDDLGVAVDGLGLGVARPR